MTDTVRKRRRGPTLLHALNQAIKAGIVPAAATVHSDGRILLEFDKREDKEGQHALDEWTSKHAR